MNASRTGTGITNPEIENGQLFDDSYQPANYTVSLRYLNRKNILFFNGTVASLGKTQMGNATDYLPCKLYYTH